MNQSLERLHTAVYYPHSYIRDEEFLKYALVFWDKVEVISPGHFREPTRREPVLQEAAEIVEMEVMPSYEVKSRVESRVHELFSDGKEQWISARFPKGFQLPYGETFPIHFEKFSSETWSLLERRGLAIYKGHPRGPETPAVLGLTLMSILADELAGRTRNKITDRVQPYTWIADLLAKEGGGEVVGRKQVVDQPNQYRVFSSVQVPLLNVQKISLAKLVELRRLEEGDPSLRALRLKYVSTIRAYVEALQGEHLTEQDARNLAADYSGRLEMMARELRVALDLADSVAKSDGKVLAGIYMAATAILGAAAYLSGNPNLGAGTSLSALQGIEKIGGLLRVRREHAKAKKAALRESPISWGYLANLD